MKHMLYTFQYLLLGLKIFFLYFFSGISQITRRIIRGETIFKCSLFEESRRELMFLKPQYIFIYIIFFLSFLVKNLLHEWHNTISECLHTHIRTKIYFALSCVLLTSLESLKVSTDCFFKILELKGGFYWGNSLHKFIRHLWTFIPQYLKYFESIKKHINES